jgi:hypothetical protein
VATSPGTPILPLSSSSMLLDQVQHLRELEAFEPERFLAALAADLGTRDEALETLGALLDRLRQALGAVDEFTRKAMGIRMTHVLASAPVTRQLRTLLSATVTSYAEDTALLRRRLSGSVSEELLGEITAAAEQVLGLRQALRSGILRYTQQLAGAQAPWVKRASADRTRPDPERRRLRQALVDLEQLAVKPERLATAGFEERLKSIAPPEEELEREPEPGQQQNRFSLLEVD